MGKDSRLSFRISTLLDKRIDEALEKAEGQIRDRSEFGTKAIKFYLDYIENTMSEEELIFNSILALADFAGENGEEIQKVQKLMKDKAMIPQELVSRKLAQDHPDFSKLMGILEKSRENSEFYKELSTQLRDASYDDVDSLYEEYSEKFFLTT